MSSSLGLTAAFEAWYTTSSTLDGPDSPTEPVTIGGNLYKLNPAQAAELRSVLAVSTGVMRLRTATQED